MKYDLEFLEEALEDLQESFIWYESKKIGLGKEFYNSVNCLNCLLNDEEYISVDHINFKMSDLISAAIIKKECLEETLINKYNCWLSLYYTIYNYLVTII